MEEKKIWQVLEISPTKDENSIKDAYRRKLVCTNPEDDPEGFKLLRECYEQAIILARKQEEEQEETPVGLWIKSVEQVYSRISERTSEEAWKQLLSDELCVGLDSSTEACEALLVFLTNHYYLPQKIWQMIANTFCLVDIKQSLYEILPNDFVDYILRKVSEEDFVDLSLLEGDEEADYDEFIKGYFELKSLLDQRALEEAKQQLEQLEDSGVNHPLLLVEKMRYLLYSEDKIAAANVRNKLIESSFNQPYAMYFVGICFWECDETEQAGKVWEQLLSDRPEYYWAKYELIKYYMKNEDYDKAKEYCLDVLEEIGGQEQLVSTLSEINNKLLEKLEAKWESETAEEKQADESLRYEIAWCYFQNKRFNECEQLLDYEVSDAYEFEYNNLKGRNYLADARYKEALPYLERWLELSKALKEDGTDKTRKRIERKCYAYYAVGFCYKKLQNYDKAKLYLEEGSKLKSEDAFSCKQQLAEVYLENKEFEKCIDLCSEMIEADKNFYPAYLNRQKAYYELKDAQKVIDDFYHCYHLFAGYYEPYVKAMKVFINYNQFKDALDIYNKAKESGIESLTLAFYKLQCERLQAENRGQLEKILEELQKIKVESQHQESDLTDRSSIDCEMAMIHMQLDDYEQALEAIESAISMKANEGRYLWIKADILESLDRDKEALEIYQEVRNCYPNNANVYFDIGKTLQNLSGPMEEILTHYQKVIELDPHHTAVYGKIAELYDELYSEYGDRANYEKAVDYIKKQLENFSNCYYYVSEGLIYLNGYELEKALEAFHKAMEENPEDIYAYNNTGYTYKLLERYEEAIKMYEKAISKLKNKETTLPYYNLAVCYLILGRYNEALKAIQEDLKLFPRSMKCRELLEEIYERMRAHDKKIKCLKLDYKEELIEKGSFYEKLAGAYADEGSNLFANYYYKRSIACDAENVTDHVLEYVSYLIDYQGKYRQALHQLMTIQNEVKDSRYDLRKYSRYLCMIYGHYQNEKMAKHYFEQALETIKEEYGTLENYFELPGYKPIRQFLLGTMYVEMGEIELAELCLSKMIEGHKCRDCHFCECYEALLLKGLIEEKKGNGQLASEYFKRAYALQPADGLVRRKYMESN